MWLVIGLIIGLGIFDIYLICFVIKNFRFDLFLENFKKIRNIVLIIVALAFTFFVLPWAIPESENALKILLVETAIWIWIQALFSD